MARQQGMLALILALVLAASGLLTYKPLQLGLDLQGGSQLTARTFSDDPAVVIDADGLNAVKEVVRRRIDGLGLSQTTVQVAGKDKIIVQLPGSGEQQADLDRAARQITQKAFLQFTVQQADSTEQYDEFNAQRARLRALLSRELANLQGAEDTALNAATLAQSRERATSLAVELDAVERSIATLFDSRALTGEDLSRAIAAPVPESNGLSYQLNLTFTPKGGQTFADITKEVAGDPEGRRIGIVLDGRSISEATVGAEFRAAGITGGGARITGNFSEAEARNLEVQLQVGSLPYDVEILESRSVGASLGADNVRRSLAAALSGLLLVALFMVVVYRLPGVVAVIALSIYALLNLSVYALIPVVLTLPGIAGFILSFGMALDANVLISERTREELRAGNSLYRSVEAGFNRAFSSILDGNVTTLISCVVLGYLGSGLVRGFAITLGIGVALSMFTALTCSRTLLRLLLMYSGLRQLRFFMAAR
ncbi:MAG: protein translocase subunit SecD [Aphanocapsa feldmannii 277cV]|uniref:Protein translocase subunit SecD n=2 Tax=Aphanocapsa feldmannii TaxID=192050 RepID=A0A524RPS0_9CHRO|nr:MAG: protein translocase subunit SecD [Aphanocapsa feldmannii 277cV]TGH19745.1 MAG: protein translocase subunit SecD [Aphanocapsa feldmannii 277cI]